MKPYYYLLERGDDPVSAYRKTYDQIMRNIEFRTWYRNRPLGSDYEDEVILAGLNADDNDNPYDVLLRNGRHEAKLKEWKTMRPEEKWVRAGGGGEIYIWLADTGRGEIWRYRSGALGPGPEVLWERSLLRLVPQHPWI